MPRPRHIPLGQGLLAALALALALVSGLMLERARSGLEIRSLSLGDTPATLYRLPGGDPRPLVVVAHGFAGSRQMMQAIALTLARAGLAVVSFDFHGHGRNPVPMSPDVTRIEGTTAALVAQTQAVAAAARALPGIDGPVSLLGHSMATDVVVRASDTLPDTAAVVAVSMYSDAVTPGAPRHLLVISGAWESHLRAVALSAVLQIAPDAAEGETVAAGPVERRAAVAPHVGHVGVLWSVTTLQEARAWIMGTLGQPATGPIAVTGPWLLALLLALVLLYRPLPRLLRARPAGPAALDTRVFLTALAAPILPAAGAALLFTAPVFGLSGFGSLALFFGLWGATQLALLRHHLPRLKDMSPWPALLMLAWGLGVFALALDRYGAAFLPTGPRLPVMALMACGTVPFALADAMLTHRAAIWRRVLARLAPLLALFGIMLAEPTRLGLTFSVLAVYVLFLLVYGTMARWTAARSGPLAPALASGVILAFAIAASTPLFGAG